MIPNISRSSMTKYEAGKKKTKYQIQYLVLSSVLKAVTFYQQGA
jgi:hypothetical protein